MSSEKKSLNTEVIVTIVSAVCLMATTIGVSYIGKDKDIREVFKISPDLDEINFVDYLGLEKNKIFHYEIQERSILDGKEYEKVYNVDVKVVGISQKNNKYLIEFDNDIFFPLEKKEKNFLLLISNMLYIIPKDEQLRVIKMFNTGDYSLKDTDDYVNPNYILPFFDKQTFPALIPLQLRGDNMYINYVEFEGNNSYFDGKKTVIGKIYRIYYHTVSDKAFSEFTPYIGFTHHSYHHNTGTRVEYNIELKNTEK